MYFPDLSPYNYQIAVPDVLHVGWLEDTHPFQQGGVPDQFLQALKLWWPKAQTNATRGRHYCDFCRLQEPSFKFGDDTVPYGNYEIWIPGPGGTIFAAPQLILHYIEAHRYCPPEEFISAVLNIEAIEGWDPETESLKKHGVFG